MLLETAARDLPDAEYLAEWIELVELDSVTVWADFDGSFAETWGADDNARHTYAVLDADGIIVWRQADGTAATLDELAAAVALLD